MLRRKGRSRSSFVDGDLRHNDVPRWMLPLPAARIAEQPMVWDPRTRSLIAPWQRDRGTLADEQRIDAVAERVVAIAVDRPCWVWPDERDPVPVEAVDVRAWLRAWARDRACYTVSNLVAA